MMEMARKAMFDILGDIQGSLFADLFAGSGAAGIEALSRGAAHVTFVEHDPAHFRLIKENLASLKIVDQSALRKSEVSKFIETTTDKFDVVFAAPWYKDVTELTITGWEKLLLADGILVLEHRKSDPPPTNPNLTTLQTKHYGDTALTFYSAR